MEIYDKLIKELTEAVTGSRRFPHEAKAACPQTGSGTLILSKETAYELGAMGYPATGSALFRTGTDAADEVLLLGEDLTEIKEDGPFARFAVVTLDGEKLPADDEVYKLLKDIEFAKYRVFPADCLIRLSPANRREQLRVGKKAVEKGMSLSELGSAFIEEYKKNPAVKAVTVIFVTARNADYKLLEAIAEKANAVTETLNKIFDGLEISCDTCELKPICDEVEGLRELHFGKEK